MNRLGNLDNLSFGMGLGRAKPGQYIPAKNANFDGFNGSPNVSIKLLVILGIIGLVIWSQRGKAVDNV